MEYVCNINHIFHKRLRHIIMKNFLIILIFTLLLFCCSNKTKAISDTRFSLGTFVTIQISDHGSSELLDQCFEILTSIENSMSTSIKNSDISKINSSAGVEIIEVTKDTAYVINRGIYYGDISKGRFDISIGPLVNLWEIGSGSTMIPAFNDIEDAMLNINYKNIALNSTEVFIKKGMSLDLGGIAKGYAADKVYDLLKLNGVESAIINLGGNIKVVGRKPGNKPFRVGIQDPFKTRNSFLGILDLVDQSIVSSGDYERFFELDGKRYHHIFDKSTGYPLETEISSVSVICQNSIDADALSTVFFSLDIDEGFELAKELGDISLIYITKNKKIYISDILINNFKLTDLSFTLLYY